MSQNITVCVIKIFLMTKDSVLSTISTREESLLIVLNVWQVNLGCAMEKNHIIFRGVKVMFQPAKGLWFQPSWNSGITVCGALEVTSIVFF